RGQVGGGGEGRRLGLRGGVGLGGLFGEVRQGRLDGGVIAGRQVRQQLVADAVARQAQVGVGGVLPGRLVQRAQVKNNVGAAGAPERAHQPRARGPPAAGGGGPAPPPRRRPRAAR